MKAKFYLFFSLIFGSLNVFAEDSFLVVEKTNGDLVCFLLADGPSIIYDKGMMIINGNSSTSYGLNDVKNFHFSESDVTAADNAKSGTFCVIAEGANAVRVQNATIGASVTLTNVNGTVLANGKVDNEGVATLVLPSAKGVYVLSVGNKSFKLIRK